MTLDVELKNERDIVVSHPELGFSVTYRKLGPASVVAQYGMFIVGGFVLGWQRRLG